MRLRVAQSQRSFETRLQPLHEVGETAAQRVGNGLERLKRHVALAPLNLADVRPVQARLVGEDILGPAALQAQCPNGRPKLLLNVLHQKQFVGSLVLGILVITSS